MAGTTVELSAKQRAFVTEYLVDLNASQACIRAGYSAKTADVQGPRLLGNIRIAAAIEAGMAKRVTRTQITQDRVLQELALLAFSDVTHYAVGENGDVSLAEGAPPHAMRALQSIKRKITTRSRDDVNETIIDVEVKLWDKPGPLKLAGRHVGLFPNNIEVTGKDGGPIEVANVRASLAGKIARLAGA